MENKKKIYIIFAILGIIFFGGIIIYFYANQEEYTDIDLLEDVNNDLLSNNEIVNDVESDKENTNSVGDNKEIIAIHITGEVKNPGIIYLKQGARIDDAIKGAGGITKNANLNRVNLAYILSDGQKIYIPNKNEKEGTKEYIISNSGENVLLEEGNRKESESSKGVKQKVNINTANQTELETLPGIGPSLAQRIMEYRESNGKFQKIEDLQNVKGIGDSKYSNIKDNVCI